MTNRVPDYTEMLIDLEVWDLKHLNDILAGLRAKDVVSSAARAKRLRAAGKRNSNRNMLEPFAQRDGVWLRSGRASQEAVCCFGVAKRRVSERMRVHLWPRRAGAARAAMSFIACGA